MKYFRTNFCTLLSLYFFAFCISFSLAAFCLEAAPAQPDIVIISTNDPSQAHYWQSIFDKFTDENVKYIAVYEDWPDGADNGLGSLYAFIKADKRSQEQFDINLKDLLRNGGRVCLFHCAGVGKRLYPLTASECNNKSAVKIPGKSGSQSILELVLNHSLNLTASLHGRLSVFWGDQIFIPSEELQSAEDHVNIFAMVGSFPSQEEWTSKNLHQYGLIILNGSQTKLVEKTTYPNLLSMVSVPDSSDSKNQAVGVSLGSFSISAEMLDELLAAFHQELESKTGKLNTDYHFWMPLTWSKGAYIQFMASKGTTTEEALDIYDRMQTIKSNLALGSSKPLFGVQNVGEDALWLDFGSTKSYYKNLMALLSKKDPISSTLAEIFGIDKEKHYNAEKNSLIINCEIDDIEATNSILMNVKGKKIVANETIIIDSALNHLSSNQALVYKAKDPGNLELAAGEVRADIFFEQEPSQVIIYSSMNRDSKEEWKVILPKNGYSFEEVYHLNENRSALKQELN